jgi:methane/ammonia monooxygenase subunit A
MGFSLLLYPNNWVILAPYHQASEQYGTLMSLADIIGFRYVRTSMPEYIRIIERGTSFSIIAYFVWWHVGKMFSTVKYMETI